MEKQKKKDEKLEVNGNTTDGRGDATQRNGSTATAGPDDKTADHGNKDGIYGEEKIDETTAKVGGRCGAKRLTTGIAELDQIDDKSINSIPILKGYAQGLALQL